MELLLPVKELAISQELPRFVQQSRKTKANVKKSVFKGKGRLKGTGKGDILTSI